MYSVNSMRKNNVLEELLVLEYIKEKIIILKKNFAD